MMEYVPVGITAFREVLIFFVNVTVHSAYEGGVK
jgi:hypothetical protein